MKERLFKIKWIILLEAVCLIIVAALIIFKQGKVSIVSPPMNFWQSRYAACSDGKWSCGESDFADTEIEDGKYSDFIYGPYMSLPAGDYIVSISYSCDSAQKMYVHDYEDDRHIWGNETILSAEKHEETLKVLLTRPIKQLEVRVGYSGCGNLTVDSIVVATAATSLKRAFVFLICLFAICDFLFVFYPQISKYSYILSNGRSKNRMPYFDLLRFLSAVSIFLGHFWAQVDFQKMNEILANNYLLRGTGGKHAVGMLAVSMGYFSTLSGKKETKIHVFAIQKYVYFFMVCFVTNIIYYFAGMNYGYDPVFSGSFLQVIGISLILSEKIFGVLWSMKYFLAGSIICFINSKKNVPIWGALAEMAVLLCFDSYFIFVPICIFGYIIFKLMEHEKTKEVMDHTMIQITMLIVAFVIVKGEESKLTYFMYGLSWALNLLVISYNDKIKAVLNMIGSKVSVISQKYMGIFILHVFTYKMVIKYFPLLRISIANSNLYSNILCLVSLIVMVILAFPVEWIILKTSKFINKYIDKALN